MNVYRSQETNAPPRPSSQSCKHVEKEQGVRDEMWTSAPMTTALTTTPPGPPNTSMKLYREIRQ